MSASTDFILENIIQRIEVLEEQVEALTRQVADLSPARPHDDVPMEPVEATHENVAFADKIRSFMRPGVKVTGHAMTKLPPFTDDDWEAAGCWCRCRAVKSSQRLSARQQRLQAIWCGWGETLFLHCHAALRKRQWPELTGLACYDSLYSMSRPRHAVGGDELHCIREQIFMEYDIPAAFDQIYGPQP